MSNLKKTTKIVETILKCNEQARNSDDALYKDVLFFCGIGLNLSVFDFFSLREKLGVPPFESVRRARQKLQARYPELRACPEVQEYRAQNEEEYEKYARGAV